MIHATRVVVFLGTCLSYGAVIHAQTLGWTRQLGSRSDDFSRAVSADGLGNVYVTGFTEGALGGADSGGADVFLSKYDATGAVQWTTQFGTNGDDYGMGVSADGLGSVYISGGTFGSFDQSNAGLEDAFVSKYDASGAHQWTRQMGTSGVDYSLGVSADRLGNVYISGLTEGSLGGSNAGDRDAFVAKYDASGTLQWTRQLGTGRGDRSNAVSADGSGKVYISGMTEGSLGARNAGEYDAFVAQYDASGTLQWTRQIGTSTFDESRGVSADGLGNVYISGRTFGSLGDDPNAGDGDVFLSKYDESGEVQWIRQIGTSASETGWALSANSLGHVYVSGPTRGNLGRANSGGEDAYVGKYDAAGTLLWMRPIGTRNRDLARGVSADGDNVYVSGSTWGSLDGTNAGGADAFVARLEQLEPIVFNDGGLHVVDSNVTPRFVHVFDGPNMAVTTAQIMPGAVVGTDGNDNSFEVFDTSIGEILGGEIENDVEAHDHATVNIYDGVIGDDVQTEEDGQINIFGGHIGGDVEAAHNGRIRIMDGFIGDDVQALESGRIEVFGGWMNEDVEVTNDAEIFIHGGVLGPDDVPDERLEAYERATITLFGRDFHVNGVDVGFGPIALLSGNLSGTLSDGMFFDIAFAQENPGQIRLAVPEPASLTLWGMAAAVVACCASRRRRLI